VHESRLDYSTYRVPVEWTGLPADLVVERLNPSEVDLTLSGPRRRFFFVDNDDITIIVDLHTAAPGLLRKEIMPTEMVIPEGLALQKTEPARVDITIAVQDSL
jgi:hypothetical protein